MRMPIFSYFLVMGSVLAALLIWLGGQTQSGDPAPKTSQIVGLPKPFKPPPETSPYKITGMNFAAEREGHIAKPAKSAEKPEKSEKSDTPRKQKSASRYQYQRMPTWGHFAEYAYDRLGIH